MKETIMIRCTVTVGAALSYTGLFSSTCDAVADAIERFPGATRISVKACP